MLLLDVFALDNRAFSWFPERARRAPVQHLVHLRLRLGEREAVAGPSSSPASLLIAPGVRFREQPERYRNPFANFDPDDDVRLHILHATLHRRSDFVNPSDRGHFDNMGLYELVRRRCRYIIVSDHAKA